MHCCIDSTPTSYMIGSWTAVSMDVIGPRLIFKTTSAWHDSLLGSAVHTGIPATSCDVCITACRNFSVLLCFSRYDSGGRLLGT